MRAEKIEIFMGKVFLVIIASLITFLVVDYISRFFITNMTPIERKFPVHETRVPMPYTMFGGKPSAKLSNIQLNSHGFVGKYPEMPKPKDETRIIVLGGSTVFGGDPAIPVLLEQEFSASGASHIKVYNFGVVSSVSGMELARIVFDVGHLMPDLILFYNGGNDILHPWTWDPRPGYPFNFIAYESNPLLKRNVGEYPAFTMLAYGSNLLRSYCSSLFAYQFTSLHKIRKKVNWKTESWEDEIVDTYLGNLKKAEAVSRGFGAGFLAFYQPLLYFKDNFSQEERAFDNPKMKEFSIRMRKKTKEAMAIMQKNMKEPFIIDFSGIYEHEKNWVFIDEIHTRQEMKPQVAKAIHEKILARNVIPHKPAPTPN